MELVKQRKRRLLAWLITIALCIGIWQGNAYATGTDGQDEQTETTSKAVSLFLEYLNENEKPEVFLNVTDCVTNWESGGSGYIYNNSYDKDTLSKADVWVDGYTTDSSNTFRHKVIGWRSQDGTNLEDPLKLSEEYSSFTAVLGKSICVNYLDEEGSSVSMTKSYPQQSSGGTWSPEMRKNANNGRFFVNWSAANSGGSSVPYYPGTSYAYNAFEEVLNLSPQFSNAVSGPGTYSLVVDCPYTLGAGTWSVGDGYSYSGGQQFYVSSSGTYNMTQ